MAKHAKSRKQQASIKRAKARIKKEKRQTNPKNYSEYKVKYFALYDYLTRNGGNFGILRKLDNDTLYRNTSLDVQKNKWFMFRMSNTINIEYAKKIVALSNSGDASAIDAMHYQFNRNPPTSAKMIQAVRESKRIIEQRLRYKSLDIKLDFIRDLAQEFARADKKKDDQVIWQYMTYKHYLRSPRRI